MSCLNCSFVGNVAAGCPALFTHRVLASNYSTLSLNLDGSTFSGGRRSAVCAGARWEGGRCLRLVRSVGRRRHACNHIVYHRPPPSGNTATNTKFNGSVICGQRGADVKPASLVLGSAAAQLAVAVPPADFQSFQYNANSDYYFAAK
jgi:hypothetical protein